ncbi:hypothetical protein AB0K93_22465 [Streptomyces sp. NPDC052676]|uniref:hypothetical protein n=1 Tax=Streptomyces sp. NPDC052676 TaxID=3154953 RepID=UPI003413D8E5
MTHPPAEARACYLWAARAFTRAESPAGAAEARAHAEALWEAKEITPGRQGVTDK